MVACMPRAKHCQSQSYPIIEGAFQTIQRMQKVEMLRNFLDIFRSFQNNLHLNPPSCHHVTASSASDPSFCGSVPLQSRPEPHPDTQAVNVEKPCKSIHPSRHKLSAPHLASLPMLWLIKWLTDHADDRTSHPNLTVLFHPAWVEEWMDGLKETSLYKVIHPHEDSHLTHPFRSGECGTAMPHQCSHPPPSA